MFADLIDGRGETAIGLRIIDLEEEREPVVDMETTVDFLDPLENVEVAFRLTDLVFPEPGDYRVQILGAGQVVRERQLLVIPLEGPHPS